jgi:excisionase family DNA binding protein
MSTVVIPRFEKYLTVEDVAALFHLSRNGVRKLMREGKLPRPIRVGKRLLWSPEAIQKFVKSSEVAHAG